MFAKLAKHLEKKLFSLIWYSNEHWDSSVIDECSYTITPNTTKIHYNINMSYAVAVGLNKSDCNLPHYKIIKPNEPEKSKSIAVFLHLDNRGFFLLEFSG